MREVRREERTPSLLHSGREEEKIESGSALGVAGGRGRGDHGGAAVGWGKRKRITGCQVGERPLAGRRAWSGRSRGGRAGRK